MKIPLRIVAPICMAFACTGALVGLLWWQLHNSSTMLKTAWNAHVNEQVVPLPEQTTIVADVDPANKALMHLRQGDLLSLKANWTAAQQQYELSVAEGGGLPALRKLAQAQLQQRDMDGVSDTIRKLKQEGAKQEDLLLLESIVLLRTGELVKAREVLTNAESTPQKHYGTALLHIVEGNHPLAQQELALVVEGWEPVLRSHARTLLAAYNEYALFPESPNIHLTTLLSRALAQVQECELALPLLVAVTTDRQDYRDAWIVQGYCELTTERPQQALDSFEKAYSIDPQKAEIQYFLGRSFAALDQHDNAITFLQYALTNGFTPEKEVRLHIASTALEAGKGELALEQYAVLKDAEDATAESYEGYILTSLAIGNADTAFAAAKEATEKWANNGKLFELLGTVELQRDNKLEATLAFQKAIELDPFLVDAKKQLEQLQGE